MKITQNDITQMFDSYASGRLKRDSITIDIDTGINSIDTLVLLRAMSKEPDVVELAPVVEAALDGHTIKFLSGDKVIKTVVYNRGNGNALHVMFADAPYLYDMLQQTVYALLLKKLTPHLDDSN